MTSGAVTPGVAGRPRPFPQKSARPAGSAQPMFTDAKNRLTVLVMIASFDGGLSGRAGLGSSGRPAGLPREAVPWPASPVRGWWLPVTALLCRLGDHVELVAFRIQEGGPAHAAHLDV